MARELDSAAHPSTIVHRLSAMTVIPSCAIPFECQETAMKSALQSTRRLFLQSTTAAAAAMAASVWAGTGAPGVGSRKGLNRGRIYKANKGGGIGKTSADYVATLNEYKRLGFDGIEGGSPDIKDIPALQAAIAQTGVP